MLNLTGLHLCVWKGVSCWENRKGPGELEREGGLEDPMEVKGWMRISDSWER